MCEQDNNRFKSIDDDGITIYISSFHFEGKSDPTNLYLKKMNEFKFYIYTDFSNLFRHYCQTNVILRC